MDVDIIESHHEAKIDAPSGTALALARMLAQEGQFLRNQSEEEPLPGTRGGEVGGVGIHSVRMMGRSAHHEVVFGTAGQTLTLRHRHPWARLLYAGSGAGHTPRCRAEGSCGRLGKNPGPLGSGVVASPWRYSTKLSRHYLVTPHMRVLAIR